MLELQKFEKSDFDRLISWIPDERFLVQWAGPIFNWPLDKVQLDKYLKETEGTRPKRYVFKAVRIADDTGNILSSPRRTPTGRFHELR